MIQNARFTVTQLLLALTLMPLAYSSDSDPELLQPQAIVCHPNGNIYVADSGNARVAVFDPKGQFIKAFGRKGNGPGEFQYPENLAVMANGDLVVADIDTRTIHLFTADGTYKKVWKKFPTLIGELLPLNDGGLIVSGSRGFRFQIRIGEDLGAALLTRYDAKGNLTDKLGSYQPHKVPIMALQQNAGPLTMLGDSVIFASRITNELRIFENGKEQLSRYPTAFVPKEPKADMDQTKDKDGRISYFMKVDLDLLCFGIAALDDTRLLMLRASKQIGEDEVIHSQLVVIDTEGKLLKTYPTSFQSKLMALSPDKQTAFLINEDDEGWQIVTQRL